MDSNNSNKLKDLLKFFSDDDSDTEASDIMSEETEETNKNENETEAEFEFSYEENSEDSSISEDDFSEISEEEPDNGEESEFSGDTDIPDEDTEDEYTEPIIKDEDEREEKTIFFTRLSGKSSIIRKNDNSDEEEEESENEPEQETRNEMFSGPVSDDTPSEVYESSDEKNSDEEVFRSKRQSFSYRSAKKEDRTNRIMRNPEDNIRYVRRESETVVKKQPDTVRTPKKKNLNEEPETRTEISFSEPEQEKSSLSEKLGAVKKKLSDFRQELFGIRSSSERPHGIDIKSVPEVDYFSIDAEIAENPEEPESENKEGFFRKLGKALEGTARNSVDDYNEPADASLILEDLYSLKTNLTVKFFVQLAAVLLSVYLSASAAYHIPAPYFISNAASPHGYSFAMFIISAIVLFSSFPTIIGGMRNLFRKKADCDSLVAVSITLCTIAAAVSTESPELIQSGSVFIFAPVAVTAFLANTLGKHLIVERAINNFDILISSPNKHSLIYVDNETRAEQLTKGAVTDYPILAATKRTGFSADFLKYSYSTDAADKLCRKLVPASLFISVVLTLLSVLVCSRTMETLSFTFVSAMLSMFISVCSCFGIPLVVNLPLAAAASEAEDNESLILGYQSIDDFYDTNSLIINAEQLFPARSLKLCKIKTFSDTRIDEALVTTASLVIRSGSIFTGMFREITDYKDSVLENVENFIYEDSLGLCGWVKNKRILFGSRQLMVNHNIEGVPSAAKEQETTPPGCIPLYLSISGNLAAVYTVAVTADPEAAEYAEELTDNGISLIIRSVDCVINVSRISQLFDIPEDMIKIIPSELNEYCDDITVPVSRSSSSVICNEKLSSVTKAFSNIRHIHRSSLTGLVLQSTSAVLALFFAVIFMFIGIITQVSPLMIILYHTVWVLLTMFITRIKPR